MGNLSYDHPFIKKVQEWISNYNSTNKTIYTTVYNFDKRLGNIICEQQFDIHFIQAFEQQFKKRLVLSRNNQFNCPSAAFYIEPINYIELAYKIYNHVKNEVGTKEYYTTMDAMKATINKLNTLGLLSSDLNTDLLIKEIDLILKSGRF